MNSTPHALYPLGIQWPVSASTHICFKGLLRQQSVELTSALIDGLVVMLAAG